MAEIDFHHNFNLFFDGLNLSRQNEDRTEQMKLRPQMGTGLIRRFVPRFDIDVVVSEVTFHQDCSLPLITETPMIELSYCLQGKRELIVDRIQHQFGPGSCTLQLINEVGARFEFSGNEPYVMVAVGIPVPTFHHFMENAGGGRSVDFCGILGQKPFRLFQEKTDPAALITLQRLLKPIRNKGMNNLEMECSVLDLLSKGFRSFLTEDAAGSTRLSKSDMQKIREARDIMIERMVDPPSLMELSRLIGMNDFKLKVGFKEMYGTTVFGYLRDKRLEKALALLQQGHLNVNETSCAIGYSNSSYFSEVFREKYGINPGQLLKHTGAGISLEQ